MIMSLLKIYRQASKMQREGSGQVSVFLCSALSGVLQTNMRAANCSRVAMGEPQGDPETCLALFFSLVHIEQRNILAPPTGLIMEIH